MSLDQGTITAVKEKAEKLFSNGKFKNALATFEKIEEYGKNDPRIFIRMGDCARKLEQNTNAAEYYSHAIGPFVKSGFTIKAIGVCKMIMHIDPSREDVQKKLADLISEQEVHEVEPAGRGLPVEQGSSSSGNAGSVIPSDPQDSKVIKSKEVTESKSGGKRKLTFPRTPLFSDLKREELFDVVRKVHFKEYDEDSIIFSEGDSGDSIFIIVEGEVEVAGERADNSRVQIALLQEGSFFGEFGFFSGAKRHTSVKTKTHVELLELRKADMDEIIKKYPRVSHVLFNFYKERVVDRLMALSDIFAPMDYKDRIEVLKHVKSKDYKRGEDIMVEGEVGDTMYLIKSGVVEVWVKGKSGERKSITELHRGDFVGEIALATQKPRVASVTAIEDVEVVVYSRPMIKHILERYPVIKDILTGVIKKRVTGSQEKKKQEDGLLI